MIRSLSSVKKKLVRLLVQPNTAERALLIILSINSCQDHRIPPTGQIIQPAGPKPDLGFTIGPQM